MNGWRWGAPSEVLLLNVHRAEWIGMLTAVCFVLGALLALTVRTQESLRARSYNTDSQTGTVQDSGALQLKILQLQNELASLRGNHKESSEAKRLTTLSGLSPVIGPGLVITLADNPQISNQKQDSPLQQMPGGISYGIIHDVDVLRVVNELFAAHAEAIAVNNQRIGPGTAIRCVGPVINVNQVACAPPYKIQAIGDPAALTGVYTLPGGVVQELKGVGCLVTMERSKSLSLPAFDGAVGFRLAHPVQPAANDDAQAAQLSANEGTQP